MIQIAACGSGVIALCIGVTGLMELAAGGSLEDALKAMAFTAASFGTWHVVGTALSAAQQAYHLTASAFFVLKTSVHGVVGGALSLAQGGSFIDGFVSNAVGAAAGLGSEGIFGAAGTGGSQGFFGRTAVAAIAGGTASELTGGKFANGALTAAFAQMWNAEREAQSALDAEAKARAELNSRYGDSNRFLIAEKVHVQFQMGKPGMVSGFPDFVVFDKVAGTIMFVDAKGGLYASYTLNQRKYFGQPVRDALISGKLNVSWPDGMRGQFMSQMGIRILPPSIFAFEGSRVTRSSISKSISRRGGSIVILPP